MPWTHFFCWFRVPENSILSTQYITSLKYWKKYLISTWLFYTEIKIYFFCTCFKIISTSKNSTRKVKLQWESWADCTFDFWNFKKILTQNCHYNIFSGDLTTTIRIPTVTITTHDCGKKLAIYISIKCQFHEIFYVKQKYDVNFTKKIIIIC